MTAVAGHAGTPLGILTALAIPTIEASPTITVIEISVEENVPELIRALPSKKSQIAIITRTQKTKHASASHFAQPDRRMPSTISIHSADVCTMCRMTPVSAPTTSKAAITTAQQMVKTRKSFSTDLSGCAQRSHCYHSHESLVNRSQVKTRREKCGIRLRRGRRLGGGGRRRRRRRERRLRRDRTLRWRGSGCVLARIPGP